MAEMRLFSPVWATCSRPLLKRGKIRVRGLGCCCSLPAWVFFWAGSMKTRNGAAASSFGVVFRWPRSARRGSHLDAFPLYHGLFKVLPFFNYPRVASWYIVWRLALGFLVAFRVKILRARPAKGGQAFWQSGRRS